MPSQQPMPASMTDVVQCVGARRQRRIIGEPVFQREPVDLTGPILMAAQAADRIFPETGGGVGFGCAGSS